MYGYHGKRSLDFLRITMAMPRLIAPAKRLLEQGLKFGPFPLQSYQSYEANIDFEIRCVCMLYNYDIFNKSWKKKASYILCDLSFTHGLFSLSTSFNHRRNMLIF